MLHALLEPSGVDQYGLDKLDRQIPDYSYCKFQRRPCGLDTLAAAIGEDSGTLEDVYEPYLLKNGFRTAHS